MLADLRSDAKPSTMPFIGKALTLRLEGAAMMSMLLRRALVVSTLSLAACQPMQLSSDPLQNLSSIGSNRADSSTADRAQRVKVVRGDGPVFDGIESVGTGGFLAKQGNSSGKTSPEADDKDEKYALNLLDASIAQASKSVLGDILGASYTISDQVKGKLTLQTAKPLPRREIVELFEQGLHANGAALVRVGTHFRIVPTADAAKLGGRSLTQPFPNSPGTQSQFLALKYTTPSEMKRLIESVLPAGTVQSADDSRNMLVVSGTPQELSSIADLVGIFDVDWMRGMSFAIYPVRAGDPESMTRELEPMLGIDAEGPQKGALRLVPNRRLGAIMVISKSRELLRRTRILIAEIDKVAETKEERLFVYKIRNRTASELAAILTRILPAGDGAAATATSNVAPRFEPTTAASGPLTSLATSAATVSRTSNAPGLQDGPRPISAASSLTGNRGAGGALTSAAPGMSGPAAETTNGTQAPGAAPGQPEPPVGRQQKIVADEANNALIISATRKEYTKILQILDGIDVLPTQVMLEALIAEVTLNDELKFGVKWAIERGQSKFTLSDAVTGAIASRFPGFSYFFNAANIQAAIDAVSSITKVNVASAPTLMVLDNRKATLQIGDQVPLLTQQLQNTNSPIVVNSIAMRDTGIILNVTPRVSDSGRVVLEIEQEVSSPVLTQSSGIDSPTIQQRRIRTTVAVRDGEVVALGGLIQERNNITKSQIPILGDIPVVGTAFRSKSDKIDRTELLIFIRPLVVRNSTEAREVTQEFRSRINLQRPTSMTGRNSYDRDARRIFH